MNHTNEQSVILSGLVGNQKLCDQLWRKSKGNSTKYHTMLALTAVKLHRELMSWSCEQELPQNEAEFNKRFEEMYPSEQK